MAIITELVDTVHCNSDSIVATHGDKFESLLLDLSGHVTERHIHAISRCFMCEMTVFHCQFFLESSKKLEYKLQITL